jgi:Ca2+-binding EF-hand superfamily protein
MIGNGSISKEELEKMVYTAWINAFKALEVSHGDGSDATNMVLGMMESMCQDLAKQFASQCFAVLDENKDGVLSLQEFKKFATADPKVTAKLNGFTKEAKLVNL